MNLTNQYRQALYSSLKVGDEVLIASLEKNAPSHLNQYVGLIVPIDNIKDCNNQSKECKGCRSYYRAVMVRVSSYETFHSCYMYLALPDGRLLM